MSHKKPKDFLLEIGTEELPPKQIMGVVATLAANLEDNLKGLALTYREIKTFSSPRRLAVLVAGLVDKQPEQTIELRGPSVAVAFDKDGQPTIAALKFAESCGVAVAQLKRVSDKKGEILFHQAVRPGKNTTELLPEAILSAVKKISVPRAMYWGEKCGPFIRPIHWVVALYDHEVIPVEIFGIKASNKTVGHRFHYPKAIIVSEPGRYEQLLMERGFVVADFAKRRHQIQTQIAALTQDEVAVVSEDLLNEVTNLTEWPVVLMGSFDARFLKIPKEVLTSTLEGQQRLFPIADEAGELLPRFLITANLESKAPQQVVAGNERVVQARFADAEYFYQNDRKTNLADNLEKLKTISFQDKLGTLYDKTMRLKILAQFIAEKIGAGVQDSARAAELAKCDLVASMVWEFPELQGVMGYYYANEYENRGVAIALKEQYLPKFAKDQLPETELGCVLALADRLDNLMGFFGINKIPSSDKDPFGLRRAASGILRIILEKDLNLDLKEVLEVAYVAYSGGLKNREELVAKILDFIYERLRYVYLEQNKNVNVFRAVWASMPTSLQDFTKRFAAVDTFVQLPEAADLIEIYKRIKNILDKAKSSEQLKFNPALMTEKVERELAETTERTTVTIRDFYKHQQYSEMLRELIKLKAPLGKFFEKVMVMVDDEKIRHNRLALLKSLQGLFILIADLSYLVSGQG